MKKSECWNVGTWDFGIELISFLSNASFFKAIYGIESYLYKILMLLILPFAMQTVKLEPLNHRIILLIIDEIDLFNFIYFNSIYFN